MTNNDNTKQPQGIGGWLGILGFLMMLGFFSHFLNTFYSSYIFEKIGNIIGLGILLFLLFLFVKHHKWFPRVLIAYYSIITILMWLAIIGGPLPIQAAIVTTIFAVILIAYLLRSKRVKNTFVRTDFSHRWEKEEHLLGP